MGNPAATLKPVDELEAVIAQLHKIEQAVSYRQLRIRHRVRGLISQAELTLSNLREEIADG